VGALLGKLCAAGLERRVGDHAAAAGCHPEGQFGLCRQRSTQRAIFCAACGDGQPQAAPSATAWPAARQPAVSLLRQLQAGAE
jgi:hypothetical protein